MDDSPSSPVKEGQPGTHEDDIVAFSTAIADETLVCQESISRMLGLIRTFNFAVNGRKLIDDHSASLEVMRDRWMCLMKLENMEDVMIEFTDSYNNLVESIRYFNQTQLKTRRCETWQHGNKPVVRNLINRTQ